MCRIRPHVDKFGNVCEKKFNIHEMSIAVISMFVPFNLHLFYLCLCGWMGVCNVHILCYFSDLSPLSVALAATRTCFIDGIGIIAVTQKHQKSIFPGYSMKSNKHSRVLCSVEYVAADWQRLYSEDSIK